MTYSIIGLIVYLLIGLTTVYFIAKDQKYITLKEVFALAFFVFFWWILVALIVCEDGDKIKFKNPFYKSKGNNKDKDTKSWNQDL